MEIFDFELEFNHDIIRQKIEKCCTGAEDKGYVCIIDGPSLVRSHTNADFLRVLKGAMFNSCDGGSVAAMASRLRKQELKAFTGPEILAEYINRTEYRQVMLGNTAEMYQKVVQKLPDGDGHLFHVPLPFSSVEEFDYVGIARELERLNADIIWVSLGAPKQEFFMERLLPHLKRGIMLGIGAAFAFYLGELKDYSFRIGEARFNWIYRIITEPKKQLNRVKSIFRYYPAIYLKEKKKIRG